MSVAITASATTAADRKGLRAILAAYQGEVVTFEDVHGSTTGVLSVGDYTDAETSWDGRDGFTLSIVAANGDFVGTGVWSDDACGHIPTKARVHVG